jgi:hypothetical protein
MRTKTIGFNAGGYGDNAKVGRYYGTRQECEIIDVNKVKLYPVSIDNSPDYFDLACERKNDY